MGDLPPLDIKDRALCTRHYAALDLLRRGVDQDGELMLSYVIWPTGWLDRVSSGPTAAGALRERSQPREPVGATRS